MNKIKHMEILKRAKLFWREVHRTSRGPLTEACESINTSGLVRSAVQLSSASAVCLSACLSACLPALPDCPLRSQ